MRLTKVTLATGVIFALLCLFSCQSRSLTPSEGFINVTGGKVWYRIVGSGSRTPLLVLHGGPGVPSYYLKPLAALAEDRPVIFYDQLGCGKSDKPDDTTLWRTDRFVEELGQVRQALGLDEVHILGHSWGTALAMDYMLTNPQGVKSLIMASPLVSAPIWIHDADSLLTLLPDSIQAVIKIHEEDGTTDAPEYQAAMMLYYQNFLARKLPWSADTDSSLSQLNPAVYVYMCGPSEFTITGTLRDYDRTDKLQGLNLPVLFTAGQYDEATPSTVQRFQKLVPGAELAVFPNCGHLTMQDDSASYDKAVRAFLNRVDFK